MSVQPLKVRKKVPSRGSKPGERRGGGSRKGVPNKITKALKDMILGALEAKGGQEWFELQMDANPNAMIALLGKIVPQDINAKVAQSPLSPEQADRIVNGE